MNETDELKLLRFHDRNSTPLPDDAVPRAIVENLDALYGTALRLCGRADIAEDLVHESVKKALRASPGLPHQRQVRAWVFKILLNCVRDHFREHARHREEAFPEEELILAGSGWQSQNIACDVRLALETLSFDRRALVLLIDFEGFTIADTAVILNLPPGTVASRLARAHVQLRDFLRSYQSGKTPARGER